jgi:hypothetical protein
MMNVCIYVLFIFGTLIDDNDDNDDDDDDDDEE